jgi:hypothetical protein
VSRRTYSPGAFVRIPLADGSYGYGQLLEFPYASFFDLRTTEPTANLDAIASASVMFTLAVHKSILDRWEVIGQRPLSEAMNRSFERFIQHPADPSNCRIVDRAGRERRATPAECVGLEPVAVWEPNHVEDRLLDAFMHRPNKWVESMKVQL